LISAGLASLVGTLLKRLGHLPMTKPGHMSRKAREYS
jgi:hypothetical protein